MVIFSAIIGICWYGKCRNKLGFLLNNIIIKMDATSSQSSIALDEGLCNFGRLKFSSI